MASLWNASIMSFERRAHGDRYKNLFQDPGAKEDDWRKRAFGDIHLLQDAVSSHVAQSDYKPRVGDVVGVPRSGRISASHGQYLVINTDAGDVDVFLPDISRSKVGEACWIRNTGRNAVYVYSYPGTYIQNGTWTVYPLVRNTPATGFMAEERDRWAILGTYRDLPAERLWIDWNGNDLSQFVGDGVSPTVYSGASVASATWAYEGGNSLWGNAIKATITGDTGATLSKTTSGILFKKAPPVGNYGVSAHCVVDTYAGAGTNLALAGVICRAQENGTEFTGGGVWGTYSKATTQLRGWYYTAAGTHTILTTNYLPWAVTDDEGFDLRLDTQFATRYRFAGGPQGNLFMGASVTKETGRAGIVAGTASAGASQTAIVYIKGIRVFLLE